MATTKAGMGTAFFLIGPSGDSHEGQKRCCKGNFQLLCWNCNCAKGHFGVCPHERERKGGKV